MLSPSLPCLGNLYIYISGGLFIPPLRHYYICVCIYVFSRIITVFVLICLCILYWCLYFMFVYVIQYNCCLYFILIFCSIYLSSAWVILPLHHCYIFFILIFLWMLYLWLLRYVCVLHTFWSLVELHLGNRVMDISYILFLFRFRHPCWPAFTKVD